MADTDHPDPDRPKTVIIGGDVVGQLLATFADGDTLVEALRKRAAFVGVSYGVLEDIAGMAEGSVGKYLGRAQTKHLTCGSLTKVASALGLKAVLITDEALTRQHREHWGQRDAVKARTGQRRHAAEQEPVPIG